MKHPYLRRIVTFATIAAAAAFAGCATQSFLFYKIATDNPKGESVTIEMRELRRPVKVFLDTWGIPHIQAEEEEDLLRVAGYMQGRDRFFMMDALRRLAQGRISELVGEQPLLSSSTVEMDLSMRGWGFADGALQDAAGMDDKNRALMQAYTDGINAALKKHVPIEYRLLNLKPEPWKIEDSFAVGRLNAWSVTHNWHQETSRLLLALNVGIDRAEKIYGNDFWHGGFSIQSGEPPHELPPAIVPEMREMFPPRSTCGDSHGSHSTSAAVDATHLALASNSWVLAGDITASGKPIQSNDPHMTHFLPSVVYQMHLMAPGLNVAGATVPGLPYILMGHNETVAWGMTSAVGDAIDLVVEKIDPKDPESYILPAGSRKFTSEKITIKVRYNQKYYRRFFNLRRTVHGPVMNDMYPGLFPSWAPPVSMRWMLGSNAQSIAALGESNRAKNLDELIVAASKVAMPLSTYTASDSTGEIAIIATGIVPKRKGYLGTFPVPGWLDTYDWTGSATSQELPNARARTAFFAHANNLMVDPRRWPVLMNIDSAPSYRFDRISQMIGEGAAKKTVADMEAIQRDFKILRAERLVPIMISDISKAPDLTPVERSALSELQRWDRVANPDSSGPVVFFTTYREAIMEALKDELDEAGFEFVLAQRYSTNVADLWFDSEDNVVWDNPCTSAVEKRSDVVKSAFRKAVAAAAKDQGADPSKWRWGKLHKIHFSHLFGSKKVLDSTFNLKESEAGGALDSVWKSHFDMANSDHPFKAMAGPVYRMVVDLGNPREGRWIIDTGASGWPGSPHYGDQFELWKKGETIPMWFDPNDVIKNSKAMLTFR